MTMKEIARRAGVSAATVSHVINGTKRISAQTEARVLAAIREANYTPNTLAKSLRQGRTRTIGVLAEDIRGLPVPGIVGGIGEALEVAGYQMLFADLHLLEKLHNHYEQAGLYRAHINAGVALLREAHVDGIVYVGMHDRPLDGILDPVPTPLAFAYAHGDGVATVTYDNRGAAEDITRCLIARGHRRIAVLGGHPHSYPTAQRLAGYQIAMQAAGLPIEDGMIRYGDWEAGSGHAQTQALLALPKPPTAIFAMNDPMAAGCLRALAEAGLRVPRDVSVAGFDNRELAAFLTPPLTTVALPTDAIGRECARLLLAHLAGEAGAQGQTVVLPCARIDRGSVGDGAG